MSYKQLEKLFAQAMSPMATFEDEEIFINTTNEFLAGNSHQYFKNKAQNLVAEWAEDIVMIATVYA